MAVENPDDINGIIDKASKGAEENRGRDRPDTEIKITLYQNGFQVENGEFRDYNSPESQAFMKELNEGYVPKELAKKYNRPIGVGLVDRRAE